MGVLDSIYLPLLQHPLERITCKMLRARRMRASSNATAGAWLASKRFTVEMVWQVIEH